MQWNIRGLAANREQIPVLFKEHNIVALCLQETKLGNQSPNFGSNYVFFRSPPLIGIRAQGGAGIIVHKSVNYKTVQLNTVLQACAVQIFTNRWVTLCSLYLDPNFEDRLQDKSGNPRQLELNDLQSLVDQLPQPYIIMGDFNAKHTMWGEQNCDRWGCIVEDLIDNNDVTLLNDGSSTRHDVHYNSSSAIDLTLCSPTLRLDYQWSVDENCHGSDHYPLHMKYVKNVPSSCLPKWKSSEADWKSFNTSTKVDCKVKISKIQWEHMSI